MTIGFSHFYLPYIIMIYTIKLETKELEVMSRVLQDWPYRVVKPILDKIAIQVDEQNKPMKKETPQEVIEKF